MKVGPEKIAMLLRFGCENFRSIKEYQELSLIAGSISDSGADLLDTGMPERVVPAAVIYGGNASGKSNVLKAIDYMRHEVRDSFKREPGAPIPMQPFRLDPDYLTKPSAFDMDFILEGVRYHYGFKVNERCVLEEWLYSFPKRYRQVWFHRTAAERDEFYFGKELRGQNRVIASMTKPNSLFISAASQNNHEQLLPIFRFFLDRINVETGYPASAKKIKPYLDDKESGPWIRDLLHFADIGIDDIKVVDKELKGYQKNLSKGLFKLLNESAEDAEELLNEEEFMDAMSKEVILDHGSRGNLAQFGLDDESSGTIRFLALLGPIFDALSKGNVFIVDEFDSSIHPLLSRKIVGLFQSSISNTNKGQLIFSTHDTNLLCGGILRRDQIWFTEKRESGDTILYPLTDIKTRKADNLEKGYLHGRFGAIPFLSKFDDLFA